MKNITNIIKPTQSSINTLPVLINGALTFFLFLLIVIFLQVIVITITYNTISNISPYLKSNISISEVGLVVEALVFCSFLLFNITITGNLIYSYVFTNVLYLFFIILGIIKIKFLSSPIVFYDLFQINDLLLNIDVITVPALIVILTIILILSWLIYKLFKVKKNNLYRVISLICFLIIIFSIYIFNSDIKKLFIERNIKYKWNSNIIKKTQKYGFHSMFIQSLYFSSTLEMPEGYNTSKIKMILNDSNTKNLPISSNSQPANIIILMIESFQDTNNFPWPSSIEPMPTFQKMKKQNVVLGEAVSPVFGGKSVNSEFELLTGFSSVFLPKGSIPYKDFIKREVPSIAHQLKANNYKTNVVQVVEMHGYGYETIYDYLGFDNKYSLSKKNKQIKLDPTKKFGSSTSIASKIIEIMENQEKSFVFAFPNSTHAPWKMEDYPDSKIYSLNQNNSYNYRQLSAYFNSLNHIDILFEELTLWANKSNEETIILIVGDHQPALNLFKSNYRNNLKSLLVPFMIWSNYELKAPEITYDQLSMNFLSVYLLEISRIKTNGFYKYLSDLKKKFPVISSVIINNNNKLINDDNIFNNELIKKYQYLQYYYLTNGNQHQ